MKQPDLSIIIANYNRKDLVKQSIDSIKKHTKEINYEFIVIDDCSTDDSVEFIKKNIPGINLIVNEKNSGPVVANNNGIKKSKGRYILVLDNDTIFQDNVLKQMVDYMDKNPKVGVTGCKLVYPDGSFQKTCGDVFKPATKIIRDFLLNLLLPWNKITDKNKFNQEFHNNFNKVEYLCSAVSMMRREAVKKVGLSDEQYHMYADELDWFYRISKKHNWDIMHLPYGPIIHYGGASGRSNNKEAVAEKYQIKAFHNSILFYKKNYGLMSSLLYRTLMFFSLSGKSIISLLKFNKNNLGEAKIKLKLIKMVFTPIKVVPREPALLS